jgi:AcrR family transcriptional regulator
MAYEVTKLVHGRPYRYRVRSERDPATGKTRNRWTYLGRADAAEQPATVRVRRNAREALLDAVESLLATVPPDEVTAAAISTAAGLAHGTFYRSFKNRNEALLALFDRVRAESSSVEEMFDGVPASRASARADLRTWATLLVRKSERHGATMRAVYILSSRDDELMAYRQARRATVLRRVGGYLAAVYEAGFAPAADPAATAGVLFAMIEGLFRDALFGGGFDEARAAAAVDLIERAVFGTLD